MGGSKAQTIGFAYFMGLHMVMSKGPIDALLAIRVGGRTAWDGTRWQALGVGVNDGHFKPPFKNEDWRESAIQGFLWRKTGVKAPVTASERIVIQAADLFGGKEREGGIAGALDVMMGEKTQMPNDYLAKVQGVDQPAYRNVFSAVFRGGMVGAMNPYLKPWSWRVRRNIKGWQGNNPWYPTAAEIDVGGGVLCMNPAHVIYQVLTDTEDGMGYPSGTIDDASFRAAADVFKAEKLGLFLKWAQSDNIEEFVKEVNDHCNAFLVQDPVTALFKLIPLRNDYVVANLLELNPNNAVLEKFERATLEETVNEITVKWDDTYSRNEGSVTLQNLANIQAMGGVVNQTKTYAGVPTLDIARRLAQRDLDISSALLARCRLTCNRIGRKILPGMCVVLRGWTKLGLAQVVVRVLRVKYGGPDGQSCTIEGSEDVFGLPVNTYVGTEGNTWVEPDPTPIPSPNVMAFEAPYRDIVEAFGDSQAQALNQASGYIGMVAQRPTSMSVNFKLYTRQGTANYVGTGAGDFTPTGLLQASIGKTTTVFTLEVPSNISDLDTGTVAFLGDHPDAEAVRVDAIDGTIITVARGVLDTVPQVWPAGTRFWGYDNYVAEDPTEYTAGEIINAKAVTVTSMGELDVDSAPMDPVTLAQRAARPYPPARFRVNSSAWPVDAWNTLTASWVHRSRIIQADVAVGTDEGTIGPEAGTTYTARWWLDGVLVRTQAGITGTSDDYTPPAGSGGKTVTVTVNSVRDGLPSWQSQTHTFIYRAYLVTEAGDRIVTEEGDPIILE